MVCVFREREAGVCDWAGSNGGNTAKELNPRVRVDAAKNTELLLQIASGGDHLKSADPLLRGLLEHRHVPVKRRNEVCGCANVRGMASLDWV